jgi:hypothetical protein
MNTFLIFQNFKIENFQIMQYEHFASSTNFSNFQTQVLEICLNFQKKSTQK